MALDPITAVGNIVNTILGRVLPDKVAKDAATAELQKLQLSGELAQITGQLDINKVEAASTNWFVAGWRPAVGWVCVLGLFYSFIVQPLGSWFAALVGHPVVAPALNIEQLFALLLPLLGVGGARTYEKVKGVDTK